MNAKRYIIAGVALSIFTLVFDFIVHGLLLDATYKATASVWRPEAEMQSYMPLMFATQILFAFVFAFIFTHNYEGKGLGEGMRFGLYLGVFVAILQIRSFCFSPIPLSLPIAWAISFIVWGVLGGIILSLLYKEDVPA